MQQHGDLFGMVDDLVASPATWATLVLVVMAGIALSWFIVTARGKRSGLLAAVTIEGLLVTERGRVVEANQAACRLLGRSYRNVVGQPIEMFFTPEQQQEILRLQRTLEGTVEAEVIAPGGARRRVDVLVSTGGNPLVAGTVYALRPVYDHEAAERRATALSYVDRISGVATEALLHDRLSQALSISDRSGASIALLRIEVPRIGEVRSAMGRSLADRLVEAVAKRLRGATRDIDTVACASRDGFVIVQPFSKQPDSIVVLSRRLTSALSEPYMIDGHVISAPATLGIALHPNDGLTADGLLEHASLALDRARADGGGGVRFFDEDLDRTIRARHVLEAGLRLALEQGEMRLYFQPIFEAGQLWVTGYEALLRWDSPVRGLLLPGEFLPLAHQCGLAAGLGDWVLDNACAAAATWPRRMRVAVNLPVAQFQQHDLPERIAEKLARAGVAPERLELEITEDILLEDTERAIPTLRALKAMGIRLSLDDFGTGYSSLSHLRLFQVDRIKIDRSFVSGLGTDPSVEPLIRAMLMMARMLSIEVTAVGVETEEQLEALRSLKCDYVQGFLLGRPIPSEEVERAPTAIVPARAAGFSVAAQPPGIPSFDPDKLALAGRGVL